MAQICVNTRGVTRFVILTRHHAIKIPRFWHYGHFRWNMFLYGLLGNLQEREFSKVGWPELCPVLFAVPGGWLLIMPRCEPVSQKLTDAEFEEFAHQDNHWIPVENKADSFGILNGRLVAIDYGS